MGFSALSPELLRAHLVTLTGDQSWAGGAACWEVFLMHVCLISLPPALPMMWTDIPSAG